MIASVLFYGFYPLCCYWFRRVSAAKKKDLNGPRAWDGDAAPARMSTHSQATVSDPSLTSGAGPKTETEERMKEPTDTTDKELNVTAQYDETNVPSKDPSKLTKMEEEEQMEPTSATHQGRAEDPKGRNGGKIQSDVFDMNQNAEGRCVLTTGDTNPEQTVGSQLGCLLLKDSTAEITSPVQKTIRSPSLEESVAPSQHGLQQSTSPVEEQKEDKYEFLIPDVTEVPILPISPNIQTHPELSEECVQPYLAFPAGPGLVQPLLPLNVMHYYLPAMPPSTFEVEWRVWQECSDNVSRAEPDVPTFPFTSASMDFTVMSYNILADDLLQANPDLYTHCPREVLDWNYRCMRILMEIEEWTPDILCLQEVQETHFYEHLHPVLSRLGYNCVYKRRTGPKTDGCATCYHINCFSEVSVSSLEFHRPETKILEQHNVAIVLLLQPVATRGSHTKPQGPLLCVVNTHLLFNPRRGDVKLAQLAILLAEMNRVVQSLKARGACCNLVMCGDFNSVPHKPLYQLITTGQLYYQGLPAWKISGQEDLSHRAICHRLFAPPWPSSLGVSDNCQYTDVTEGFKTQKSPKTGSVTSHTTAGKRRYSHDFMLQLRFSPAACVRPQDLELIPGVTDNVPDPSMDNPTNYNRCFSHTLRHQLDLKSVYSHFLPGTTIPEVTTMHSEGGATVDYIFYSPTCSFSTNGGGAHGFVREGLKLTGSLSLLSEDILLSLNGLPNATMPSDHLSLLAKFQMDLSI